MNLRLRNPHSVIAVLETRPHDVVRVNLSMPQRDAANAAPTPETDPWGRVAQLAKKHGIPLGQPPRDSRGGGQGPRHESQGGRESATEAEVKPRPSLATEEIFATAGDKKRGHGVWLALDSLQDPQNVGAIFRAAAFFGVRGIMMTEERSAPLSAAAYDVASGGIEHVPFVLQTNLQRGFEVAKAAGLWILGTSEHAKDDLRAVSADRDWLIVLGNEEKGMRRLTQEACDVLCKISPKGKGVTSLNVSVAAGILISRLS